MSRPTGPPPVTRTRSSGRTSASSTAWMAMAVGSARAATRVVSESGMRRALPADTVTYWANAPRISRMSDGPRSTQTEGRPRRHGRHRPHPGVGLKTTRSPPDHAGPAPWVEATVPDHS